LETIVRHLAREGFHRFFLSINYLGTKVKEHFGDGSRWNVDIAYIEECTPMGTAGALGLLPERPSLPFLVMNGDLLTDVSLGSLVDYHCRNEATATVAICKYDVQVPFGVTRLDGHYVVAIEEKPKQSFQINAGIYVFEPSVLDMIEPERALDAPQLVMRILAKGGQVAAFPLREMWLDIGRHEDLLRARSKFGDEEA
jgi:NDP-sugar pyrophosphorylase family protein